METLKDIQENAILFKLTNLELARSVQVVELGLGLKSILQGLKELLLESIDFLDVSEQSVYLGVRQKCFLL